MSGVNDIIKLKSKIEKLNKNQTVEIFKIVYKNGDKFTQNKNGIFLDINTLNEQSINEIRAFIEFTEDKGKHINEIEAKIKENINSIENNCKFVDKNINNEFQIVVCTDYSPFITDIDDNFLDDKIERGEETGATQNVCLEEDLNEIIDEDELNIEEEDTISISQTNSKKKKNTGVVYRILKKCKNINTSNAEIDEYEKDNNNDDDLQELTIELEII